MPIRRSRLVVAPLVLIGGALAAQVPAPTPVDTTTPVGLWVMRTAESVVLTD